MDLNLFKDNQLKVFVDSDSAFTSGMCVKLTRALRNYLEESDVLGTDFSLEVSSPGLERPLQLKRQYLKNIGRELELTTADNEKLVGELVEVEEDKIELKIKRKKKETEMKVVAFDEIKKAKVSFQSR